ncbi:MAG: glycosyltransferase family 39 protein [Bacillota bacterium]|nr:glycosyltransferase family 39 protein [Bacillota bacterium]
MENKTKASSANNKPKSLKNKNGKMGNLNQNQDPGIIYRLVKDLYVPLLAVFLLIIFAVFFLNSRNISTANIQLSFIIGLVPMIGYSVYLKSQNKLSAETLTVLIIITGIFLRVVYTIYSPFTIRQHDVIGSSFNHLDYIKQIANNLALPNVGYCQAYHPPVHHIISAVFYKLGKVIGFDDFNAFRLVQLEMVFVNSMTLIFFYKILNLIKSNKLVILAAVSIFAFHPYNIYFSSFLNNDNTMYFFYILTVYYMIKWFKDTNIKNAVLLEVFLSLNILSKKPGIILIPTVFAVFIAAYIRDKSKLKNIIKQVAVFILIAVPLSLSYSLRNLILFGQGLMYVPGVNFERYANNLKNLFYIPVSGLFTQPFTQNPFTGRNELFADYVLKSSLFGEWTFDGLEKIGTVLLLATIACVIVIIAYLLIQNKKLFKGYGFIFLLNLVFPFALLLQSRLQNPVVCAQNFRYAGVGLISVAYFYGHAVNKFSNSRFKFTKYIFAAITIAFCIVSAVFILKIGVAPDSAYTYP